MEFARKLVTPEVDRFTIVFDMTGFGAAHMDLGFVRVGRALSPLAHTPVPRWLTRRRVARRGVGRMACRSSLCMRWSGTTRRRWRTSSSSARRGSSSRFGT